ncbi:MAG: SufB/SufD family protein [Chloroflexota bacterium]
MHEVTERDRMAADTSKHQQSEIDPSEYGVEAEERPYQDRLSDLPTDMRSRMLDAGIVVDEAVGRSGTFVQVDHSTVHSSVNADTVEMLPVRQALDEYDWAADLWWKAVSQETDEYTRSLEEAEYNGYFIRARRGQKTLLPLQACLYMGTAGSAQRVHNILVAEEGSELHIITGCTSETHGQHGLHLGVSEFYIRKGAKVTYTMIHNWDPAIAVRPRTGIVLEEDSTFLSNYVIMKPVRDLQTNPAAYCQGPNATVRFNSVMASYEGSRLDAGSRVFLNAPGCRTEIISRTIARGGETIARGYIEGNAPDVKGHLECCGLMLGDKGAIHAIPELRGSVAGIDLSHEAAVGKIAEEEVEYLMARGLTHSEATATIVRGFLRVDIEGLPDALGAELRKAIETSEQDLTD